MNEICITGNHKAIKMPDTFSDLTSIEFQHELVRLKDGVIIDVRTDREFQYIKIPGAINIDIMDRSFTDKVDQLDRTKNYFVYCQSGVRSRQACSLMASKGFVVYNLRHGIMQWQGAVCQQGQ